jgi:formate dehydrogenase major subunit
MGFGMGRAPGAKNPPARRRASGLAAVCAHCGGVCGAHERRAPTDVTERKFTDLPLFRQLRGDATARGAAVKSERSSRLRPRTADADRVVQSICPYCAVGCGQRVYVKDEKVIQIEGDPDSPISRGRLCPKGAASKQLVQSPTREYRVKYRPPHATEWEELSLDKAMDMIADRVIETREQTWEKSDEDGLLNRTLGFASLGGATLDNEENYLIKKLFTALGAIQIENQARI